MVGLGRIWSAAALDSTVCSYGEAALDVRIDALFLDGDILIPWIALKKD